MTLPKDIWNLTVDMVTYNCAETEQKTILNFNHVNDTPLTEIYQDFCT